MLEHSKSKGFIISKIPILDGKPNPTKTKPNSNSNPNTTQTKLKPNPNSTQTKLKPKPNSNLPLQNDAFFALRAL